MALDFSLSDEQQLVRTAVADAMRRFSSRRQEFMDAILNKREVPQELWQATVELGMTGAVIPEEYGGNGMGLLALTLALEEMLSHGFANIYLILGAMDSACMVNWGSEDLKRKFLPDVASGKTKLCFALTEPNAGSNTARIECTARREGDEFVLNGEKVFITGAQTADYMLMVARTMSETDAKGQGMPRFFGISLFMVPTHTPGLTLSPIPTRGIEGARQWSLHFDEVRVPAEDMIGEEHLGAQVLFTSLNPERVLAGAAAVGMSRYLVRAACDYARERKVFRDTPIGAYQGLAHPLAECHIEEEAARLMTYKAAWAFDQKLPPVEVGQAANMAKYLGAELAIKAADHAIQTMGGYGFSEEYGVILFWESARLLRTAPISREMILNFVAEHSLGLPKSY